jgi:hypothetical protein
MPTKEQLVKIKQDPLKYAEHLERQKKERENNREYYRNYSSQWQKDNKDKVSVKSKKWRNNNKELHKELTDDWRKRNPINRKLWSITNWEKIHDIETVITVQDIIDIEEKFEGKCFNCSNKKHLVYDHFYPVQYKIPLSKENCVLLCIKCNSKGKGSKHPKDFFSKEQMKDLKDNYGIKIRRKYEYTR